MKQQMNFSKAQRGRFHPYNAALELPVYLDAEVRAYLAERASVKGIDINTLVNGRLKRAIDADDEVSIPTISG